MEYIFYIFVVLLVVGYLIDPKGFKSTGKRIVTIVRSNIEAAKPIKQLESSSKKALEQKSKDKWTAEFSGKELDNGPKHVIVKTWYAKHGGSVNPFFKCKCGHVDWHVNVSAANRISKEHVSQMNHAEELLKKNGGTHAW